MNNQLQEFERQIRIRRNLNSYLNLPLVFISLFMFLYMPGILWFFLLLLNCFSYVANWATIQHIERLVKVYSDVDRKSKIDELYGRK